MPPDDFDEFEKQFGGAKAAEGESFDDFERQLGGVATADDFDALEAKFGEPAAPAPRLADMEDPTDLDAWRKALEAHESVKGGPVATGRFAADADIEIGSASTIDRSPRVDPMETEGARLLRYANEIKRSRGEKEFDSASLDPARSRDPMGDVQRFLHDEGERESKREEAYQDNKGLARTGYFLNALTRGLVPRSGTKVGQEDFHARAARDMGPAGEIGGALLEGAGAFGSIAAAPGPALVKMAGYGAMADEEDPVRGALHMLAAGVGGKVLGPALEGGLSRLPPSLRAPVAEGLSNPIAGTVLREATGQPTSLATLASEVGIGAAGGIPRGRAARAAEQAGKAPPVAPRPQADPAPADALPPSLRPPAAPDAPLDAPPVEPARAAPEAPAPVAEAPDMAVPPSMRGEARTSADFRGQTRTNADISAAPGELTSAKNRVVDYERAALHMSPLEGTPVRGMEAQGAEARRRLAEDSTLPDRLTKQILSGEKVPSAEDTTVLAMHRVKLGEAYEASVERLTEAQKSGDPEKVAAALAEQTAARTVLDENGVALNAGGSEQARGLGSRRWMVDEEFSLRRMEIDALAANEGRDLPPEKAAEIKAIHAEVSKADKVEARLEERFAAEAAGRALDKIATTARTTKYGATNKGVTRESYEATKAALRAKLGALNLGVPLDAIPDLVKMGAFHLEAGTRGFARWSKAMVKDLGESIRPNLRAVYAEAVKQAPAMTDETGLAEAGKIAELVMREGVKGREAVLTEVHAILKETNPEVTRRQVNDAIAGYGKVRPLNQDPIKVELRELKGQMQQLAKLDDMAQGRAPLKSGPERQAPGDEQRRLIKEVNEAKRVGGYDVRDPAAELRSTQDAIKTRLKNDITDLDRQIAAGKRDIPDRTKVTLDADATALKARRDALRKVLDILDPPLRKGQTEQQRIAAAEKAIDRATAEYERRVRENDLEPKRKVDEAFEARKEKMLTAARARGDMARSKWREKLVAKHLANQTLAQKAMRAVFVHATALQRVIQTTFDFSLAGMQGGLEFAKGLTSPTRMRRFLGTMGEGFKAFVSPEGQARAESRIKNDPGYESARLAKTKFGGHGTTKVEEALRSDWGERIPVIRNFQRFGTTFMNRLRLEIHKAAGAGLSRTGKMTPDESRVMANFANVTTGRGSLGGKFEGTLDAMNHAFFAPRWMISRFQVALAPFGGFRYGKGATARTRVYIAKEYARALTGIGMVYALAAVGGAEVVTDPDSPDFGKIRVGDTKIDPMMGLLQAAMFLKRVGVGLFGSDEAKKKQAPDFAEKFVRGKLAPLPGAAVSRFRGKTLDRQEATWSNLGTSLVTPLSVKDVSAAIEEHGPLKGAGLGALSIFGLRLNTYRKDKK